MFDGKTTSITPGEVLELLKVSFAHRRQINAIEYLRRTSVEKQRWAEYKRILDGGDPPAYVEPAPGIHEIVAEMLTRAIESQRSETLRESSTLNDQSGAIATVGEKTRQEYAAELARCERDGDLSGYQTLAAELLNTILQQDEIIKNSRQDGVNYNQGDNNAKN